MCGTGRLGRNDNEKKTSKFGLNSCILTIYFA